jgi:hypothetical protein
VGGVRRPHFARQKYNTGAATLSPIVTKNGQTNNIASTLLTPCGASAAAVDASEATLEKPRVFFHKYLLQSGMI